MLNMRGTKHVVTLLSRHLVVIDMISQLEEHSREATKITNGGNMKTERRDGMDHVRHKFANSSLGQRKCRQVPIIV